MNPFSASVLTLGIFGMMVATSSAAVTVTPPPSDDVISGILNIDYTAAFVNCGLQSLTFPPLFDSGFLNGNLSFDLQPFVPPPGVTFPGFPVELFNLVEIVGSSSSWLTPDAIGASSWLDSSGSDVRPDVFTWTPSFVSTFTYNNTFERPSQIIEVIPEPGSLLLGAAAGLGMLLLRRR